MCYTVYWTYSKEFRVNLGSVDISVGKLYIGIYCCDSYRLFFMGKYRQYLCFIKFHVLKMYHESVVVWMFQCKHMYACNKITNLSLCQAWNRCIKLCDKSGFNTKMYAIIFWFLKLQLQLCLEVRLNQRLVLNFGVFLVSWMWFLNIAFFYYSGKCVMKSYSKLGFFSLFLHNLSSQ